MTDSEVLIAALARSEAIEQKVIEESPDEVSGASLQFLTAKAMTVLLQHHMSIRILVKNGGLDASATALFRPYLDVGYKMLWMKYLAKPERILQIDNGNALFPPISKSLGLKIAQKSGRDAYRRHLQDLHIVHDLTHGGPEQLHRQYTPNIGIHSGRDISEIATLVDRTATFTEQVFLEVVGILQA
jgi:hypothetical protein